MAYRVKIMPRAERDLAAIYTRIEAPSSDAAYTWYRGLRDAIRTLGTQPNRCPATPEDKDLRNLLYGNKPHIYRVIYRTNQRQKQVEILEGSEKKVRRIFTEERIYFRMRPLSPSTSATGPPLIMPSIWTHRGYYSGIFR